MVLMALCRSLPRIGQRNWRADFLLGNWSQHPNDDDAAAIVSARGESSQRGVSAGGGGRPATQRHLARHAVDFGDAGARRRLGARSTPTTAASFSPASPSPTTTR